MSEDEMINGITQDLVAELGTVIRYTYQAPKGYGLLAAELPRLLKGLGK